MQEGDVAPPARSVKLTRIHVKVSKNVWFRQLFIFFRGEFSIIRGEPEPRNRKQCIYILILFRAKRGLYSDSGRNVWLHPYSSRSCKMPLLLAISSCFPSPTLRLPNMDFYLQKNTERLQVSRFAGFYLSCSKVRVDFISSPIFPITSCCFFVLLIHVKHGFLFSENLIPPTLCQFWRTALPRWL